MTHLEIHTEIHTIVAFVVAARNGTPDDMLTVLAQNTATALEQAAEDAALAMGANDEDADTLVAQAIAFIGFTRFSVTPTSA